MISVKPKGAPIKGTNKYWITYVPAILIDKIGGKEQLGNLGLAQVEETKDGMIIATSPEPPLNEEWHINRLETMMKKWAELQSA